jgi:nucleotide-binding universal stress UspA family protein
MGSPSRTIKQTIMKKKTSLRKATETAAGTILGAAIAGPVGAVAGGLSAQHVEFGIDNSVERKPSNKPKRPTRPAPVFNARVKRVLVPIDFSEPSVCTMRFAKNWISTSRAKIRLLHVVDPRASFGDFGIVPMGRLQADQVKRAREALENLRDREFAGSSRVSLSVREGAAYDEIVSEAHRFNADIIVVARHGKSELSQAVMGSTAERVVRYADCPVLALPHSL